MNIVNMGPVTDRLYLLGRRESCVYLLDGGEEFTILGGGMVPMIPEMAAQLDALNLPDQAVGQIVILHSHFDHCGAVPYLKQRWPKARIVASARARQLLQQPKVIDAIAALNKMSGETYGTPSSFIPSAEDYAAMTVDTVVGDGDRIHCGNLELICLEVPGHSSCSIAVYCPEEKAMFVSDAAGIPFGDQVLTAANSNFDKYRQSLEKIASHEIELLGFEHFGARTGADAREFLNASMESFETTRQRLMASLEQTRDIQRSTEAITDQLMAEAPDDFLPKEVVALVVGQMLRTLARDRPELIDENR